MPDGAPRAPVRHTPRNSPGVAADSRRTTDPTTRNIRAIVELERRSRQEQSRSERVSDAISRFAGSLGFVLVHLACFVGWAMWNALAPEPLRFDPYPYGLLTFIVSMEGVLIATFVLITQNRMTLQSDQRDRLNLQVDLLAEQEMTLMLRMLRRISEHLGVPEEDTEVAKAEQLQEETNLFELMQRLERELPARDR
jgi:uncharacterized membrane protein